MKNFLVALLVIVLFSCNTKEKADLFVYNATIYTVDSSFSTAEAMVEKDGKIIATGTTKELEKNNNAK
jgi:predicted amidohydrolase YtcJ